MSTARTPDGTPRGLVQAGLRFAYADPPYPGQSKRLYGDHPDYAGEVDHAELVDRLCRDYPDGWALSTGAWCLHGVLRLCPEDVRVAVWNITNAMPNRGSGRWHKSWEPVIVHRGRMRWDEGTRVRDVLSTHAHSGMLAWDGRIAGSKPPAFCRWLFELLGAWPGDELHDLFPGSGIVGREWRAFQSQPPLITSETMRSRGGTRLRNGTWIGLDQESLEIAAQTADAAPQGRL